MSTLVTRAGKGSPLTHNEVDTNFTNLNTDKVEKTSAAITGGTINNTTVGATTPAAGTFTTLTAQTEVLTGTGQNLVLQSENFTVTWATSGSAGTGATANAATSPTGTSNASKIFELSATGVHGRSQAVSLGRIIPVTYSMYAKASERTKVRVDMSDLLTGDIYQDFDLSTGSKIGSVVSGGSWANTSSAIISVGSGWYRCSITGIGGNTAVAPVVQLLDASGAVSYVGNGTSGIFAWGAQLELASSAGTYIPTTTTAVYGTPTLSFSGVAGLGLQSDGSLYASSAGTGNVRFYTNNIGQEQARVSHTASAVNYHQLTGSATGSGPIHSVAGSDTNIDLNLTTKGTGAVKLNSANGILAKFVDLGATVSAYPSISASQYDRVYYGAEGTGTNISVQYSTKGSASHIFATSALGITQFTVAHTASAVNYVQVTGAITGNSPTISAQGSDASVPLSFSTKSTSSMRFYSGSNTYTQLRIDGATSAVNYVQVAGALSSFGAIVSSQGSDTNIPLVLQPKGTGALQAQQTDSTATGGNARGANAVDWQTKRNNAAQVASGSACTIGGGNSNTANGFEATIGGGTGNTVSNNYSVVSGGYTNVAFGSHSAIVGGYSNTTSGLLNFIGGGFTNSGTSGSSVTTQSATMNGTTAVTLSGSNGNIKVGQLVIGTSIQTFPYTYVAAISGTSLTLSQAASGSSTSTLSFYTPHGVVVGGGNNQATGSYSFIGGGGDAGTAANRNVASGDWSVVAGGALNTASGANSSVLGGANCNATSSFAVCLGGAGNVASGFGATNLGGNGNVANGTYAVASGFSSTNRSLTTFAYAAGSASVNGDAQTEIFVLRNSTTDATAKVLTLGAGAASTNNQVILPNNSAYFFTGEVVAGVTGGGNTKGWTIEGVIKRGANAASTALVGTPTVTSTYADAGASTWVIAVTADTTNGGLAVTFTGQAATTIRTVAQIRTTEMTY